MSERPQPSITKIIAVVLLCSIALTACSSAEGEPSPPDNQTTANQGSPNGIFVISEASDSDGAIEFGEPPTVSIDAEFGTLRVDGGCNEHFGSFTLAEDGLASFTLAGQTNIGCDASTEATERRIIDLFAVIDRWSQQTNTVELQGTNTAATLIQQS